MSTYQVNDSTAKWRDRHSPIRQQNSAHNATTTRPYQSQGVHSAPVPTSFGALKCYQPWIPEFWSSGSPEPVRQPMRPRNTSANLPYGGAPPPSFVAEYHIPSTTHHSPTRAASRPPPPPPRQRSTTDASRGTIFFRPLFPPPSGMPHDPYSPHLPHEHELNIFPPPSPPDPNELDTTPRCTTEEDDEDAYRGREEEEEAGADGRSTPLEAEYILYSEDDPASPPLPPPRPPQGSPPPSPRAAAAGTPLPSDLLPPTPRAAANAARAAGHRPLEVAVRGPAPGPHSTHSCTASPPHPPK
jgi:hypothetical protein